MGVTLLEVAAPAAANQEGVAGEGGGLVVQDVGDTPIGMPRGAAHLQVAAAKGHVVPVLEGQGDVLGAGGLGEANGAAGGLLHQPAAGDVIRVGVGIEAGDQLDSQLANEGEISVVLFKHRIDDHALAGGDIGQQIGVGPRCRVEELAMQQGLPTGCIRERDRGGRDGGHGLRFRLV